MDIAAIIAAGNEQQQALRNMPCGCIHDHPYAPRGELKHQCARCRSMAAWQMAAPRVTIPGEHDAH